MNEELELKARMEGASYFDEDYDSLKDKNKYKHEMYLNTGLWWFRSHKKSIIVLTDVIGSEEYLRDVIHDDTQATIYYHEFKSDILKNSILDRYKNTNVSFVKIDFIPSHGIVYLTKKGKTIPFKTLVLAGDNTVIFDEKLLGVKKGKNGDRQVYRIKDKAIFSSIRQMVDSLIK